MLRRLWTTFKRDMLINWRTGYVAITLLVVIIYTALIRWAIPAELRTTEVAYLLDQTTGGRVGEMLASSGEGITLVSSVDELTELMSENQNSIGIALADGSPFEATYYFQPFQGERARNLIISVMDSRLHAIYEGQMPQPVASRSLREGAAAQRIPFNKLLVPVTLFSDPAMIGLVFIAVLIFMEKDEGTLRAFLVTPGRIWEYLISKALTIAVLSVGFTLIFVPATVGFAGVNWPALLGLIVLCALFSSLLGAAVSVFFNNISQFLFPAILTMLFIGLPSIAYFVPGFSPVWLRVLPTYPLALGLREAIFPTGSTQNILMAALYGLAAVLVMLIIASAVFKRQLVRE